MGRATQPEPLKAAMAGCGGVSHVAIDAARQGGDFSVVAIQDVDEDALAATGEQYGIGRRHVQFEDLLAPDVDFVILNTPNHVHLEQVRLAAAAGKHCLVQKPMARNLEEAEAMVAAARAASVRLGVVMLELGKPLHHQLRAMIRAGWLGTPVLVQAALAHDAFLRNPPPPGNWRRDRELTGGGAFIQLAVHAMSLAAWMLGREIVEVTTVATRGLTVFEDESTVAAVRFSDGPVGSFAASYATRLNTFTLAGTMGSLTVTDTHLIVRGKTAFESEVFRYDEVDEERVYALADLRAAIAKLEDRLEVHGRFARWIALDEPFPCPGERGLQDMRALDAAYRSLQEHRSISLS